MQTENINSAATSGGFTLVELLVVLLIMGLLVGLVSVIVHPDERGMLQVEAERLARLLELAASESQLSGKTIGWTTDGSGYRFWRPAADLGWTEIHDNDLLRRRTLPTGMAIINMRVENKRSQGAMRLEFTPYSPTLSFTIEMAFGASHYFVAATPMGEIRVLLNKRKTDGELALW